MHRKAFAARVWSRLIAFDRRHRLLVPGDRVLAAVSGGPDSVALAHFLAQLARRKGFTLAIAHVHHGLRGREADGDAESVRRLGERLGVETMIRKVDALAAAERRRQGMEEAARHLRYAALAAQARRLTCNKVATGHHLDDQAETLLLNLLRGTRLRGLAGIPVRRPLGPRIELIRPLLAIGRREVEDYLEVHGLASRLDGSNRDLDLTRNWVRRKLLPLLEKRQPRIREHLLALAEQAADLR